MVRSVKFTLPLLLWASSAYGQATGLLLGVGNGNGGGGGGGATPVLFNVRGGPNTEAGIGNTNPTGQTACPVLAYCTFVPDGILAGNTEVVFWTYKDVTQERVPTVTDGVNTYTACPAESHHVADNIYVGCAYKVNAAAARNIQVTWTGAGNVEVTQAAVSTAQCFNCTAFDGSGTNNGTSSGTFTSGSVTSTVANDMYISVVQMNNINATGNGTGSVGRFSVGSNSNITWTADVGDQRDGFYLQHGVQSVAGALNPASSNVTTTDNYTALTIAFKSGSQGTAPSGMYVRRMYSVSTAQATAAANQSFQVAANAGDLLLVQNSSSQQEPTAVSDATNGSWLACGNVNRYTPQDNSTSVNNSSQTFYFPNSAAGLLNLTVTVAGGSGEVFQMYFDMAGADTSQPGCNRYAEMENVSSAASTYTMNQYAPSSSSGYSFALLSIFNNTGVGFTSPATAKLDANSYGGMSLNGPEQVDNNDPQGRSVFSSNATNTWTMSMSSSTVNIADAAGEIVSFHAVGATTYPAQVQSGNSVVNGTSATTLTKVYTPKKSGNLVFVAVCTLTAQTGAGLTIADTTPNTYISIDNNSNTAIATSYFCRDWYVSSFTGAGVTITATFSVSASFRTMFVEEADSATTLDAHGVSGPTSAATGILTGTGVATNASHPNEIVFGVAICTNTCQPITVLTGGTSKPFTVDIYDGQGNAAGYRVVSAQGTYSAIFVESTASSVDAVLTATFFGPN